MDKIHKGKILDKVSHYSIIECSNCNYKHLLPYPNKEELGKFYSKKYYQSYKPNYFTEDLKDEEYLNIAFDERLQIISKLTNGKNILDVGCGAGNFMAFSKKRGWNPVGIEPSNMAAKRAQNSGLNVYEGELEGFVEINEKKFDVIHLKNVLEHVISPEKTLINCMQLLKEDGIVYTEVPNDYQMIQKFAVKLLKERKSWISVPDHINYFTFKSFRNLLAKVGLEPIKRTTSFPIYMLLLIGYNFISNKKEGFKAHQIRVNFELFWDKVRLRLIKNMIYSILSFLHMGRTIIFYSKKQP